MTTIFEDIVRALAASDAPADGELGYCTLCFADEGWVKDHREDCPWRRAREWIYGAEGKCVECRGERAAEAYCPGCNPAPKVVVPVGAAKVQPQAVLDWMHREASGDPQLRQWGSGDGVPAHWQMPPDCGDSTCLAGWVAEHAGVLVPTPRRVRAWRRWRRWLRDWRRYDDRERQL